MSLTKLISKLNVFKRKKTKKVEQTNFFPYDGHWDWEQHNDNISF